ncbi:MAG: 2TM domain-containing protein [Nodosilinea sp.]
MAEVITNLSGKGEEPLYETIDVQQILRIAIAQQTDSGQLSRHQLLEVAEELGISAATLVAAEQEWELQKHDLADRSAFDRQRQQRFHHGLMQFLIFGGFLIGLNLLTGSYLTWLIYLIFGSWALKLTWEGWCIYRPNEYSYNRDFRRWQWRRRLDRSFRGAMQRLLGW